MVVQCRTLAEEKEEVREREGDREEKGSRGDAARKKGGAGIGRYIAWDWGGKIEGGEKRYEEEDDVKEEIV
jgi:hypothetical protein